MGKEEMHRQSRHLSGQPCYQQPRRWLSRRKCHACVHIFACLVSTEKQNKLHSVMTTLKNYMRACTKCYFLIIASTVFRPKSPCTWWCRRISARNQRQHAVLKDTCWTALFLSMETSRRLRYCWRPHNSRHVHPFPLLLDTLVLRAQYIFYWQKCSTYRTSFLERKNLLPGYFR